MSEMRIYRDQDADTTVLSNKKIAVIGYGSQGRAQARMMHESGCNVVVGVRPNGPSHAQAQADGLQVMSISEATAQADIVHILIPDEQQKACFEQEIAPNLAPGKILSFSHGFSIVFKNIVPPAGVGVIMVAPKSPGTEEYKRYQEGFGVPALISVYQDNTDGTAKQIALAMAKAMFFTKAGVIECTFEQETNEDLFGEQAVLCGGVAELVKAGFEVLTEEGYPAELAYFECLHELKLIVDLMYEGGISRMWEVVSNTAEFGGHTRGNRIITPAVKEEMRKILKEVEDGTFAREWMASAANGSKDLQDYRAKEAQHPIEIVGKRVRSLFDR